MTALAAGFAPARGFPPNQVIPASIVALALTVGIAVAVLRYRRGTFPALERLGARAERRTGLPAWSALPVALTGTSLVLAVFGFYWDVAWHIDRGRDQGPFSTPAHYPIIIGLLGIAVAGVLAVTLDRGDRASGIALGRLGRVSVGAALLALCGLVALAGFPLDDLWHTLFGQDVTLWGPTHIEMIGGASLATLAAWMLLEEGRRAAAAGELSTPGRPVSRLLLRPADIVAGGAFLVGLSTLQGEFDYGVPQFRASYAPVLVMLAAGIGLVAARVRAGRGGALGATVVFLAIRGTLTLLIGPLLGRSTLHAPLYLTEALLVELVALGGPRLRPVALGAISGLLIGTVGLAAEWGWSQVWMPLPWQAALWPQAAVLGVLAALAGGILGGLAGQALCPPRSPRPRPPTPRLLVAFAWVGALVALAVPMPTGAHRGYVATVTLTDVRATTGVTATSDVRATSDVTATPAREVLLTVQLDPPNAAEHAVWFDVTAWQGGTGLFAGGITGEQLVPLRRLGPGRYRTTTPVPVSGRWKTLLRLGTLDSLQAVPIYLPADPAIPAPAVPAPDRFTRAFVPDKQILQREAVGGSPALERSAYAVLGVIGLAWVAGLGLGLRHLGRVAATVGVPAAAAAPVGAVAYQDSPGATTGSSASRVAPAPR